jgi:Na+/melibiose symporter-like transporter
VYSQWKTSVDSRGWVVGLNVLPLKVAIIGRPVILNTSLALVGFNAARIQADSSLITPALQQNITAAFALIPAIILIIGALIYLFGFRLTRPQVVKMQEEINARQAAK